MGRKNKSIQFILLIIIMKKINKASENTEQVWKKNTKTSKQAEITNTVWSVILMTIISSNDPTKDTLWSIFERDEIRIWIAEKYFTDPSIIQKVVNRDIKIVEMLPRAYRLFSEDQSLFKDFYLKKFRKEAKSINELNDQEKYGVLMVKARELVWTEENEQFFDEEFKKMPKTIKPAGKSWKGKSPSLGKWSSDDESLFD